MKRTLARVTSIVLGFMLIAIAASDAVAENLTRDQALRKIERIELARRKLKDLANAPVPDGLEDSEARKFKNQQALVDVAASKLRLEAFQLKQAARKAKEPGATMPFTLGVSASDITQGKSASSEAVAALNAEAVKIIASIGSDAPLEARVSTSQMLNRSQVEQKIERLQTASDALLTLSKQAGPGGLSSAEQQNFSQSQRHVELMSKKLLLQKLQLQRSLATLKDDEQTIPFELAVSKSDVAASGSRSSVAAVRSLYQSIGAILDKI